MTNRSIQSPTKLKIKRQDSRNLLQTANIVPTYINVLGLVNGMISSTIMILPCIGITAGYTTTVVLCLFFGFLAYYTAYLLVVHIGKERYPHIFVLIHFHNDHRYLVLINFLVWIGYLPTFIIFIKVICISLQNILGYQSVWIGLTVSASIVVIIIVIRVFYLGENSLAYGIFSIGAYLVFLIWAQITAPEGPNRVPIIGQPMDLSAFLILAFTVHTFMPMNILKNPQRGKYKSAVGYAFIIATIIYIFVALGCYAIINRHSTVKNPQTISDFFTRGTWEIIAIQIINILHIVSTFPNFMIASKVRFFQMFKISIKRQIDLHEVVYIICMIFGCYLVFATGINVKTLIVMDGAVIKFFSVILTPIWIHLKCVFIDKSSGYIDGDEQRNQQIVHNECECNLRYKSKWYLYTETVFLVFAVIVGLGLMINIAVTIGK